ncbi:hypothetical protein DERP_002706 [Dermatophagoides pteronyssinus]|uniref:Uncharacterized protein n=1 Tax=Dermatophagoides pteronyssinus TaxID=6956 RepID=A0ABQ8JVN0_DERPT|nr:hypothetical protein DERP_002706 [Dermatophagoides pteronyssinus]
MLISHSFDPMDNQINLELCAHAYEQSSHLYGFSPVCERRCTVKFEQFLNTLPQYSHVSLRKRCSFRRPSVVVVAVAVDDELVLDELKALFKKLPANIFKLAAFVGFCCKLFIKSLKFAPSRLLFDGNPLFVVVVVVDDDLGIGGDCCCCLLLLLFSKLFNAKSPPPPPPLLLLLFVNKFSILIRSDFDALFK